MKLMNNIRAIIAVLALMAGPAIGQETDLSNGGFSIRVNGDVVTEDRSVENIVQQADVALADADIQVVFDGLGAVPRLDFAILQAQTETSDSAVKLQSTLNYPSFVTRAEFRIIDRAALGGAKVVSVVSVTPNGQVSFAAPEGDALFVVHRVYDSNGRFDETEAVALTATDHGLGPNGIDEGRDLTQYRGIPISGGAVTVRGSGVAPRGQISTLGETLVPDAGGKFIVQRILPPGAHDIGVTVTGSGQNIDETRRVSIPRAEWFTTGTVDLTYHLQIGDAGTQTNQTGRVAGYVNGRTASGVEITASVDTGEGPLDEIFQRLDEKDPRQLLLRVDPADFYPTYGDDSVVTDNTPTSGKIYGRIAQGNNFALWGDFDARLAGNGFVRNERSHYGLQTHWESQTTAENGQSRVSVDLYAAQSDRLPQRDVFRGTGGSVYFLEKQDIGAGSEVVSIQLRDPDTGRVIETRELQAGRDYQINNIQGIITLASPLSGVSDQGGLISDPSGDARNELVVQYEYTPTSPDTDGFSYGGRVEAWASNQLRVGISGIKENTGLADQTLVGADVRYQLSEESFIQLNYAMSEGVGFGSTYSNDGGLIVDNNAALGGSGRAIKIDGRLSLTDLGSDVDGVVTGYFEDREVGFSNLDLSVGATTGDEQLWGIGVDAQPAENVEISVNYDSYENGVGEFERTGGAELNYQLNQQFDVTLGVEHVDRDRGTEVGQRTNVAGKLSYAYAEGSSIYGFYQGTVSNSGLSENDRFGVGAIAELGSGWTIEGELSDGSLGKGGRVLIQKSDGDGNQVYVGYELNPGRELSGTTLVGRDAGRVIAGGRRQVGRDLAIFGENTYDVFGRHRSLSSAYGLTYAASDELRYSAAFEMGGVNYGDATDFERYALSLGMEYETEVVTFSWRLENRIEDGQRSGSDIESNSLLYNAQLRYKVNEDSRLIASVKYADTLTDESSILNGSYADVQVGYAYRPVANDQLNVLARYRFLEDMIGQRVDGIDEDGPRQISHVISVDAIYDLTPKWSVGGKLGYRLSETAADDASDFVQNDAWLAVGNITYHAVHEWDAMLELRSLNTVQAGTRDTSVLAAAYRHFGENVKIGLGYNFGNFSDDLTNLVRDDQGVFVNLVAKF